MIQNFRKAAKRTPIAVRNRRQNTGLDQNHIHKQVLRSETRKLEKSQIVLLFGNSPTRRTDHGLTQIPRKFITKHVWTFKKKQDETQGPVSSEQRSYIFQTAYKDTLKCKSSQPRGYGYMAKTATRSERIQAQFEEQLASATAEAQKLNSELTNPVNVLQDQLQAERENTQERIDSERLEREIFEDKLKEERAERERLLEHERAERDRLLGEERRSREEFEKNMMEKFAQLSQQVGTQQALTQQPNKRNGGKENNNSNMQNLFLRSTVQQRIPELLEHWDHRSNCTERTV